MLTMSQIKTIIKPKNVLIYDILRRVGVAVGVLVDCSLTAAHNAPQRDTEGFMNKEKRQKISKIIERLEDIAAELEALADEERDAFDNLPESIQYSERGEAMEAAADDLEEVSGEVTDLSERLEEIINP